jgi:hypothetical protein
MNVVLSDVDSHLGFLHCLSVGSVADVLEEHAASILRVEVSRMSQYLCLYRVWSNRPCIKAPAPPLHPKVCWTKPIYT